ncbi:alpha-galactosidase [Lentilactobacillus hilgardii]|nr:glycoside hydrolase family 36 protein [Lentilactobacillus hilgardii]MCV3741348.1 alpha-galactosidase [Lentilactobacillus hilgardii]
MKTNDFLKPTFSDPAIVSSSQEGRDSQHYREILIDLSSQIKREQCQVSFTIPIIGFAYYWNPTRTGDLSLPIGGKEEVITKVNYSMPIFSFFNEQSINQFTFAFSEVVQPIKTSVEVIEETASIRVSASISRRDLKEGHLVMYYSTFQDSFSNAIKSARNWLYSATNITPSDVPEFAGEPIYSTWYSFHQQLSQEKIANQSRNFKDYRLSSIIVDDGWQTDDVHRGYSFAGDWKISKKKFPDMVESVKNMQLVNVKYLLWLSLPYVGRHSSHWDTLQNKLLFFDKQQDAGILDIRFPEVRKHLIKSAVNLTETLNLDGLKIDFLDVFDVSNADEKTNAGWDIQNLNDAFVTFLEELSRELKRFKPDFLIEFREDYFGPFLNSVGNIFRVKDCPNNYVKNRISIANLRLLCPKAAVHSDMLMWNFQESTEAAALQVINCLFGTPQISVKLDELSLSKQRMLKFWLRYIDENRAILQNGEFKASFPQNNYPVISAESTEKMIIGKFQSNGMIGINTASTRTIDIINGTFDQKITVNISDNCSGLVKTFSTEGRQVSIKADNYAKGYYDFSVPKAGLLRIEVKQIG